MATQQPSGTLKASGRMVMQQWGDGAPVTGSLNPPAAHHGHGPGVGYLPAASAGGVPQGWGVQGTTAHSHGHYGGGTPPGSSPAPGMGPYGHSTAGQGFVGGGGDAPGMLHGFEGAGGDVYGQPQRPASSMKFGGGSGSTWRPTTPANLNASAAPFDGPALPVGGGNMNMAFMHAGGMGMPHGVHPSSQGYGGMPYGGAGGHQSFISPPTQKAPPQVSDRFLKLIDTVCNDLHRLGVHEVTIPMFEQHFARMRNGKKVAYRKLGFESMAHMFTSQPGRFHTRVLPDGSVGVQTRSYANYQAQVRESRAPAAQPPAQTHGHYHGAVPGGMQPRMMAAVALLGGAGGSNTSFASMGSASSADSGRLPYTAPGGGIPANIPGLRQPFASPRGGGGGGPGLDHPFQSTSLGSTGSPGPVTAGGFAPPPPESVTASTVHSSTASSAPHQFHHPGTGTGAGLGEGSSSVSSHLSGATGLEGSASASFAGYNAWPQPKGTSKSTTAGREDGGSVWNAGVLSAPATVFDGDAPPPLPSQQGAPAELQDQVEALVGPEGDGKADHK